MTLEQIQEFYLLYQTPYVSDYVMFQQHHLKFFHKNNVKVIKFKYTPSEKQK